MGISWQYCILLQRKLAVAIIIVAIDRIFCSVSTTSLFHASDGSVLRSSGPSCRASRRMLLTLGPYAYGSASQAGFQVMPGGSGLAAVECDVGR
jgi:hypothetical protein